MTAQANFEESHGVVEVDATAIITRPLETLPMTLRRRGVSRRTYMTAVRRLLTLIPLSLMATALLAQQPQSTTTSEVPRATEPVTADTDKDLTNPRAMHISLDDA